MTVLCLIINAAISILAYETSVRMIPGSKQVFIKANLFGKDLCKKHSELIPESMGVIVGCVFLVTMFLFIPAPFTLQCLTTINCSQLSTFPHERFVELIVALLSICCMILLGFADDVLDLRWRHKLLLPTIATLPLLMVYYVHYNSTTIIMPKFLRSMLGYSLNIGVWYYIYMGSLAVFCTNAINILAGINGLEVGQSIIIAASILIFNYIELSFDHQCDAHKFSIYLLTPFLAVSMALWKYNRYPSQVFVGDTYCYFAGMTFAVVGIVGHFSKTLILFFLPQIFNFLYSMPQLFKFLPCPRHRLPKYDSKLDMLNVSTVEFRIQDLNWLGFFIFTIFKLLKLIKCQKVRGVDGHEYFQINNFTLINLTLVLFGSMHEKHLTAIQLTFQLIGTFIAFIIRYPLAKYFYDI